MALPEAHISVTFGRAPPVWWESDAQNKSDQIDQGEKGVLRCGHSLAWWFRLQCCVTDDAMNQQLLLPNQLFDLLLSSRIGGPVVWDLLWRTGSRVHGCAVRMFMKHDFVCSLFFFIFLLWLLIWSEIVLRV